jgi:hypothetical protein
MRTPSYLDRYRAGEQTEAWAELVALGPAVRQEPLVSDALAVARETMHRVRENIERLIPRRELPANLFPLGRFPWFRTVS